MHSTLEPSMLVVVHMGNTCCIYTDKSGLDTLRHQTESCNVHRLLTVLISELHQLLRCCTCRPRGLPRHSSRHAGAGMPLIQLP